jgi:hypothetical protein
MNVMYEAGRQANCQKCELCGRSTVLTRHHLIPRTRHRNKRTQKRFARDEMQTRILWVCRSCHNHIHETFSEKELADTYHRKDLLLSHPAIQKFVNWIATKPTGFNTH